MTSSSAHETPLPYREPFQENERAQPRRVRNLRNNVQSIFVGRGRSVATAEAEGSNNLRNDDVGSRRNSEGPKTPRFTINMPNLPSTRLIIPYLRRSASGADRGSQSNTIEQSSSEPSSNVSSALPSPMFMSSRPPSSESLRPLQEAQRPEPAVIRSEQGDRLDRRSRRDRYGERRQQAVGTGPEDQELADLAARARRRRERRKRRPAQTRQTRSTSGSPPEYRSLRKRRAVKTKIVSCIASGLFLTMLLCIYLALALSNKIASQEFHVIIILIILVTTVFFCHSLIRLCILIVRPVSDFEASSQHPQANHHFARGGYANPERPIRVQLLRDEEAAGIESEVTKFPPPAYGLWRESVRVDPNRIYWARNTEDVPDVPPIPAQHGPEIASTNGEADGINVLERTTTTNRPPSYMSEDGVDYVIEARGRNIAPPEPASAITEMFMEHANEVSRDVERRTRAI